MATTFSVRILAVSAIVSIAGAVTAGPANAAVVAPTAPIGINVVVTVPSTTVSWLAPISNGGAPIVKYIIHERHLRPNAVWAARCIKTTATSCTFPTPIYPSQYRIRASNGSFQSPWSYPSPSAPTNATGVAGNGQVAVSWTAPTANGGAAIASYTATASPGGRNCTATAPTLTCTVTGLTNGTPYTFTVTATNASPSTSGPSTPSNPATPGGAVGFPVA